MPFTSKASGVVPSPRRIPEWGNSICWTINKLTQSSWNKRPHSISSIHRNSKQNSWEFHTRAENSPWFSFCQMKIHHWNRLLRIWIAEYWIMPSNWCPSMKWMLKYRNWSSITQPIWILHCKRWMHILNTKSYSDLNLSIAFFTAWNPWDLHTRCISPIAVTRPSRKRAFTCLQYRSKGRTHSGRRRQHSLCRHRNWIGEQIRRRHHQRLHCRQTLPILHWGWECWHGFVRWQGHQSRPITISRFISWSLRWVEKRECKTEGIYNLCKFPNFAYREEEEQLNWSQSHEDPVLRLNAFQYLG